MVKLKDFSYYQTGGEVQHFFAPLNVRDLQKAFGEILEQKWPFFILGAGSNSLVLDDEYPGAVLYMGHMQGLRHDGVKVVAEAGVENSHFAMYCHDQGLGGVAWMYGLPGTIGATVRMNARCYGGEISQVVTKVTVLDEHAEFKTYDNPAEMFRGYKNTIFMQIPEVIAQVEFALKPEKKISIWDQMSHCYLDRVKKSQFLYPSCGCVFKNNYEIGVPSGMLLEASKVYDIPVEKAQINPSHANFVFNQGASSRDLLELTLCMRDKVYEVFGVWLEYEMEILGFLDADMERRLKLQKAQKPKWDLLKPLQERFAQK